MATSWEELFDRAATYEVDLEAVLSGYETDRGDDSEEGSDRA